MQRWITLGRRDGHVSLDEVLAHSLAIVAATPLPVSADLENGYAQDSAGVAATLQRAAQAGLAGCSIEDYTGDNGDPIYELGLAVERITAAAEVSRDPATRLVLTGRAENFLRGRLDLADTIARLQAYQEAGADVVYAPGLSAIEDIEQVVRAVDVPVNVLLLPGGPTVPELAAVGVARVSVGGAFHAASLAALEVAARELKEQGTHGYWTQAIAGGKIAGKAFD